MSESQIWLFNIRPENGRGCVEGPPADRGHGDHVGRPWHGLSSHGAWAADAMDQGETAIVRQSQHGIVGLWTVEATAPVTSQADHEWADDYAQFVYCRALHRELDEPLDDTQFFDGQEYARFNRAANRLSDADAKRFLQPLLGQVELETPARKRVASELERLGVDVGSTGGTIGTERIDPNESAADVAPPTRTETTVSRVVRNTELATELKELYDHRCQVCGERRERGDGEPYAEAHHVHPLGASPPGIDAACNVLVLCPNHHADFDYGCLTVDPETYEIQHAYEPALNGRQLLLEADHEVGAEQLAFHNDTISDL